MQPSVLSRRLAAACGRGAARFRCLRNFRNDCSETIAPKPQLLRRSPRPTATSVPQCSETTLRHRDVLYCSHDGEPFEKALPQAWILEPRSPGRPRSHSPHAHHQGQTGSASATLPRLSTAGALRSCAAACQAGGVHRGAARRRQGARAQNPALPAAGAQPRVAARRRVRLQVRTRGVAQGIHAPPF